MGPLTLEQQRALALAQARRRRKEKTAQAPIERVQGGEALGRAGLTIAQDVLSNSQVPGARAVAMMMPGQPQAGASHLRLAGQGAGFGFVDDLMGQAAKAGAILGGADPDTARGVGRGVAETYRETFEDDRARYPFSGFGAEMVGGAVTGVGAAKAAPAAFKGGARALATSTAMGAGAGAGYFDDNRALGAAAGAVLTPVISLGGKALAKTGVNVAKGLATTARNTIDRARGREGLLTWAQRRADDMIARRIPKDVTPQQLADEAAALRARGGDTVEGIADLPSLRDSQVMRLARASAAKTGEGADKLRQHRLAITYGPDQYDPMSDELAGSGARIVESVFRETTGEPAPTGWAFERLAQGAMEQARRKASTEYQKAAKTLYPIDDFESGMMGLFQLEWDDSYRALATRAKRFVRPTTPEQGETSLRALSMLEAGELPAQQDLTIEVMHALKMATDDLIGQAQRAGLRNEASTWINFQKSKLLPFIEARGPGFSEAQKAAGAAYRKGRDTLSAGYRWDEALREGQRALDMDQSEFYQILQSLGSTERKAFQLGMARGLAEKFGSRMNPRGVLDNKLLTPEVKARIRRAFPLEEGVINQGRARAGSMTLEQLRADARAAGVRGASKMSKDDLIDILMDNPQWRAKTGADAPATRVLQRAADERQLQRNTAFMLLGQRGSVADDIADATVRENPFTRALDALESGGVGGLRSQAFGGAVRALRNPGIMNDDVHRAVVDRLTLMLGDERAAEQMFAQLQQRFLARQRAQALLAPNSPLRLAAPVSAGYIARPTGEVR